MMDYEVFKTVIARRVKDFLPPAFQQDQVIIHTVHKINEEKDALILVPAEKGRTAAVPNIYLDDRYAEFQQCQELDTVLQGIADMIIQHTGSFRPEKADMDFAGKKDLIVMNLIGAERNKKLLELVPHRRMMDLAVIYRIVMGRTEGGIASIVVNHQILAGLNMTAQELDRLAARNTGRLLPVEIFRLSDVLYVMTNRARLHGAASILYQGAADRLAAEVGGNFFVIPSSVHEVLAVPDTRMKVSSLIEMLEEGNRTCVEENEILSNSIYHYDRSSGRLSLAASYYTPGECADGEAEITTYLQ